MIARLIRICLIKLRVRDLKLIKGGREKMKKKNIIIITEGPKCKRIWVGTREIMNSTKRKSLEQLRELAKESCGLVIMFRLTRNSRDICRTKTLLRSHPS